MIKIELTSEEKYRLERLNKTGKGQISFRANIILFHVHAKDAEVLEDKLKYYGVFNAQLGEGHTQGYWRFRMPGLGQIDWGKFINALKDSGYNGIISTEHEDPLYEGAEEKVKEGLAIGRKHLNSESLPVSIL